jgi:hypothetical protein
MAARREDGVRFAADPMPSPYFRIHGEVWLWLASLPQLYPISFSSINSMMLWFMVSLLVLIVVLVEGRGCYGLESENMYFVELASMVGARDPFFVLVMKTRKKGAYMLMHVGGRIYSRGAKVLLEGALSLRRAHRGSSWSKDDRSHLRHRLRLLLADIRCSTTTSRLPCHFRGPPAIVQQAPTSLPKWCRPRRCRGWLC